MPNHIRNIIKMDGISKLPIFGDNDIPEGVFTNGCNSEYSIDFGKIVPMPPELNMVAGTEEDLSIVYYVTERCTVSIADLDVEKTELLNKLVGEVDYCIAMFNRCISTIDVSSTSDKYYNAGKQYVENFQKYGSTDFIDWCWDNWGTSWNALYTKVIDDNTIIFDSGWSEPEPVIKKLAQMYPDVQIEHWWSDEGGGEGHRILLGDVKQEDIYDYPSKEGKEVYRKCWGDDNDY